MAKKNKSVILIVVDALRAKSLGIYGKNPSPSPTIDKLAKEGILFNNAFTVNVCTDPTITSIMTGRYPVRNGLINNEAKVTAAELSNIDKIPSLAELLKKNNYSTAAIDWLSRWHRKGFDYYSNSLFWGGGGEDRKKRAKSDSIYRYIRIIDLLTLRLLKRDFLSRVYYSKDRNRLPYDPADIVTDGAIDVIESKINKNLNFFLYVHLWDTHYPYFRQKGLRQILFNSMEDRYVAGIKFVDEQVKRLVQFLKTQGLYEDTLIILVGDHGESLTEHGIYISHRGLYEGTVKVPLIFHCPGLFPKRIDSLVQSVDIVPTILDFLKIRYDKSDFDGKSLVPLVKNKDEKIRDFVYFEELTYGEYKIRKDVRRRGLRTGKYKYIQSLYGNRKFLFDIYPKVDKLTMKEELYDWEKDPQEKNNLARKQIDLKDNLRVRLEQFVNEIAYRKVDKKAIVAFPSKNVKQKKNNYDKEQVMKKFKQMGYW